MVGPSLSLWMACRSSLWGFPQGDVFFEHALWAILRWFMEMNIQHWMMCVCACVNVKETAGNTLGNAYWLLKITGTETSKNLKNNKYVFAALWKSVENLLRPFFSTLPWASDWVQHINSSEDWQLQPNPWHQFSYAGHSWIWWVRRDSPRIWVQPYP